MVETVPLIIAMVSLFAFLIGFWGLAHKNILYSIAARNYAFETFRHRSNLTYFNDTRSEKHSYEQSGARMHYVGKAGSPIKAHATNIRPWVSEKDPDTVHKKRIWDANVYEHQKEQQPNPSVEVRRPWILVTYGICLNAQCGGD